MAQFNFPILTEKQQCENLRAKGLILDLEEADIIHFLKHHSYFQLVMYFGPYWYTNPKGEKQFKDGVTISKILNDYYFDHELRILLFSQVIHIENSFKNVFCQSTCQKLGNIWWTDKANFSDTKVYTESIECVLRDIDSGVYRNSFIEKYFDKYSDPKYPPFWNMIEVFTLGQIAKMYKYLDDSSIKKEIARTYELDDGKLSNWMKIIVDIRNSCCHHNKMLDKTFKIAQVKKIEEMVDGKNETLYHGCTIIYYLLKITSLNSNFKEQMIQLLQKYHIVNHGFPPNIDTLWN